MARWTVADVLPQADDSPNYADTAPNSMEQEAALENSVKRAQDLQQQGRSDEEIVQALAAEGYSQPERIVQMMHLRQVKENVVPDQQDQQPAGGTSEPYPPSPQEAPDDDGSMYSKFQAFVSAQYPYDPQTEDMALQHIEDSVKQRGGDGWQPEDLHAARQALLNSGIGEAKVNQVINQLASETWENGHEMGMNDYYGPERDHPQSFAKTKEADMQKGSPYPENSAENAPDHSAPGHHLPDKVNQIYNACMRDNKDYGKEKCMRIAWAASGKKHEKGGSLTYDGQKGQVVATYRDMFDETIVRFATDTDVANIPAGYLDMSDEDVQHEQTPADIILDYLNQIPDAVDKESSVARVNHLTQVHTACASAIAAGKLPLTEKMRLDQISLEARVEAAELKHKYADEVAPEQQAYLDNQPRYDMMVGDGASARGTGEADAWLAQEYDQLQEDAASRDYDQVNEEQAAVTLAHIDSDDLHDGGLVRRIADSSFRVGNWASGLSPEAKQKVKADFLERIENQRRAAVAGHKQKMAKQASEDDKLKDLPDEMIFWS